ncbi:Glu-tRNAGln amidotransferase, C subunit [mine drainage metagenome]|uniref:Glu-tRNAGln amidotransferase, C subunit n=2 Tax=mine drainage metagenome TaxID=410659 RepID=T1BSX0_9ZZZZ
MAFARAEIERLAALACLDIGREDLERLGGELTRILEFVSQLETGATDEIEPLTHPLDLSQPLRPDEVTEPVDRERYQRDAPQSEDGYYLVPRVIE